MVEGAFKAAKVGGGVDELVLHIFITGDGRAADDLKKAAESLRLER